MAVLKIFKKEKPFKVLELDKNIGSAIISNKLFLEIAFNNLNNFVTYEKIDFNPLDKINRNISLNLFNLQEKKLISKKLINKLYNDKYEYKLGKFRYLPKLHKSKFSIRPIINYKDTPTENLCFLIDFILLKKK